MVGDDRRRLVEQLILHEGIRLRAYLDTVGKVTVGVGRNLTDKGLSQREAMDLLDHDIDECLTDLEAFPWFLTLDVVRQRAVIDLRFNLGPSRFRGFKRMLRMMSEGQYSLAAGAMRDSLWAKQVPQRARRLIAMMLSGASPTT